MSLSTLELKTIRNAIEAARIALRDFYPLADEINDAYNSSGGVGSTITQDNLNAEPTLSGLTTQQLADGVYAVTTTLKAAIDTAHAQLDQLALRAPS